MRSELKNPAAVWASAGRHDGSHHVGLKVLKMKVFLHKCHNQGIFCASVTWQPNSTYSEPSQVEVLLSWMTEMF